MSPKTRSLGRAEAAKAAAEARAQERERARIASLEAVRRSVQKHAAGDTSGASTAKMSTSTVKVAVQPKIASSSKAPVPSIDPDVNPDVGSTTFFYEPRSLPGDDERSILIVENHDLVLRSFISDGPFKGLMKGTVFKKPEFLFGDANTDEDDSLCFSEERWLSKINGDQFYIPSHRRHYPLSYFQEVATWRMMKWHLTPFQDQVPVASLTAQNYTRNEAPRPVLGLHPGLNCTGPPAGEKLERVGTFLNHFLGVDGNYPASDFRMPGWISSGKNHWWSKLTQFALVQFEDDLKRIGLYQAVRATCHGIQISVPNFYAILELYCPATGTFFTPAGELGLALHEMWEISRLPFGVLPYEELFPCTAHLDHFREQSPDAFDTFRELANHFQICIDINHDGKGSVNGMMTWAEYLFPDVDRRHQEVNVLSPISINDVSKRMKNCQRLDLELKEDEGSFATGDIFRSCHYQALKSLTHMATFAGFMSLWLKKCVIPSLPRDGISINALFPAVQICFGEPVGLLPAMVCGIQNGLRTICQLFCQDLSSTRMKNIPPSEGRNPRVELPYTYLMAWLALHCPQLLKPGMAIKSGDALLQLYEGSKWEADHLAFARKKLSFKDNFVFYRCCPTIEIADYGEEFHDVEKSALTLGIFRWLMCIRPSHLLYRVETLCHLEPYLPSRFARQFGYDQLYVGNPNYDLNLEGNLIDGARAWRYYMSNNTGAKFTTPQQSPPLLCSMAFCQWYRGCCTVSSSFKPNQSCVKLIQKRIREKRNLKGRTPRIPGAKGYQRHAADEGSDADEHIPQDREEAMEIATEAADQAEATDHVEPRSKYVQDKGKGIVEANVAKPANEAEPANEDKDSLAGDSVDYEGDDVVDYSDDGQEEEAQPDIPFKRQKNGSSQKRSPPRQKSPPRKKRLRKLSDVAEDVSQYVPPPGPVDKIPDHFQAAIAAGEKHKQYARTKGKSASTPSSAVGASPAKAPAKEPVAKSPVEKSSPVAEQTQSADSWGALYLEHDIPSPAGKTASSVEKATPAVIELLADTPPGSPKQAIQAEAGIIADTTSTPAKEGSEGTEIAEGLSQASTGEVLADANAPIENPPLPMDEEVPQDKTVTIEAASIQVESTTHVGEAMIIDTPAVPTGEIPPQADVDAPAHMEEEGHVNIDIQEDPLLASGKTLVPIPSREEVEITSGVQTALGAVSAEVPAQTTSSSQADITGAVLLQSGTAADVSEAAITQFGPISTSAKDIVTLLTTVLPAVTRALAESPAEKIGSGSQRTLPPASTVVTRAPVHGVRPVETPGSDAFPVFTAELLPDFIDDFYTNLKRCLALVLKNLRVPLSSLKTVLYRAIDNVRDLGAIEQAIALEQLVTNFEDDVRQWRLVKQASLDPWVEKAFQSLSAQMDQQRAESQAQIDVLLKKLEDLKHNDEDLKTDFEVTQMNNEVAAQDIARANEMIKKAQQMIDYAQGILDKSEPAYTTNNAHLKELEAESANLQMQQQQASEMLKEAQIKQQEILRVAEVQLRQTAITQATTEKEQLISQLEDKLHMYLNQRIM